jgi:hypothetical protein
MDMQAMRRRPQQEAKPMTSESVSEQCVDAMLDNLRDRRLLKYLFDENPIACGPYGYVERPLDLETQREICRTLAKIALAKAHNEQVKQ